VFVAVVVGKWFCMGPCDGQEGAWITAFGWVLTIFTWLIATAIPIVASLKFDTWHENRERERLLAEPRKELEMLEKTHGSNIEDRFETAQTEKERLDMAACAAQESLSELVTRLDRAKKGFSTCFGEPA
jgi:hypothetical protein